MTDIYTAILPYIRRIVYSLSIIVACALFYYVSYSFPDQSYALSELTRYYGFISLILIFIALLPSILSAYFPKLSINALFEHARRAIGVSAFFFALLHLIIAFFNNLSGSLQSILFLPQWQEFSIVFSTIALIILSLMAITSFDVAVNWLTYKRWKRLHSFVYLAVLLIILHAFLIGSHYTNPQSLIPVATVFLALAYLIFKFSPMLP